MRKKKSVPLPPLIGKADPIEHEAARAAHIEQLVTTGVTAGVSFRALVSQVRKDHGATLSEAEDAIRRAEEALRQDMAQHSQRDRAASYRRLLNVTQKVYLQIAGTSDVNILARLTQRLVVLEERLAKMAGWDEPERLHVQVTGPSERLRLALEGFDDADFVRLAAEDEDRMRVVEAARVSLGLPAHPLVVEKEKEK